jgi:hypothetical protein
LEAEEIVARFFLNALLNPPCYETPQNAIKKSNKTTEGGKKTEGKKAAFFVMSQDGFFWEKVFPVFLNSLVTKRPKNALKK